MLNITITEQTPHNMLRAIRAACNELLGETHADLTTQAAQHNSRAEELRVASERELDKSASCLTANKTSAGIQILEDLREASRGEQTVLAVAQSLEEPTPAVEMDSTGVEWNPELHASTKAKNQDGTWKKRRAAAQKAEATATWDAGIPQAPAAPPLPPAAEPVMPKIFALITSQIVTINQAVEAAQAEGFADLGANGLGGAPVEKQLAVLRKLESA